MSRRYKEYQSFLFDRLINSSKYPEKYEDKNFKTKDLYSLMEKDEVDYLFKVFNETKVHDEIIPLATGGVIVKVAFNNTKNLVLLGSKVDREELENLPHNSPFLYKDDTTIALFILLSKKLDKYIRIRDSYTSVHIDNILGQIEDDKYDGHDIREIMDLYEPIYILDIKEDNPFQDDMLGEVISLSIEIPSLLHYREKNFLSICGELSSMNSIDKNILYAGLTAFYRKHAFLDIYRCLEKNFYFPGMYGLLNSLIESGVSINISSLREKCREKIAWVPKENIAIQDLFKLVLSEKFKTFKSLKSELGNYQIDIMSIFPNLNEQSDMDYIKHLAEEIYKYRNSLVHHEDKIHRNIKILNEEQWQVLANFIGYFLIKYNEDYKEILL